MTVDDIMSILLEYGGLLQSVYTEIIPMIAPCPSCGSDIDQYCRGQYGRTHPGSTHADRRTAVETYRKQNREEYEQLKLDVLRHLVKMRLEGTEPKKELRAARREKRKSKASFFSISLSSIREVSG